MSDHETRERVGVLGGGTTGVGGAANKIAGRANQIDAATDAASTPPATSAPAQKAGGVDFFRNKPATDAQKKAKQEALLRKLRQRDAE